ncbi:MAG: site-2 protease family protein [Candidatus Staskawiczbacteria bacterium]|nr:site-2 protease family protein [Candidatus Staskawiczbacteria bacterium]
MISEAIITIFSLVVLLFSVMIHELAHGYVAYSLGDPTAKYEGRLTLNPFKHLDLFGSIILPLLLFLAGSPFLFGWVKPVPINPYNFRDKKYGEIKVSIAGPLSNLLLAIVFGTILRFTPQDLFLTNPGVLMSLSFITSINIWLAIFNLIPVPPLDGSWILFSFLSVRLQSFQNFLRQYGIVILVMLILFGNSFWLVLTSIIFQIITGRVLTL